LEEYTGRTAQSKLKMIFWVWRVSCSLALSYNKMASSNQ